MLFPIHTFLLFVCLSCSFALLFKPWGQMLCPSVRILLDLNVDLFYNPRFLCFSYQKFLSFPGPQFIVMAVLDYNVIECLCETTTITMCLPFPNAFHIISCIIAPYPLISLLYYCRRSWLPMGTDGRWLIRYVGGSVYSFPLTAQMSQ